MTHLTVKLWESPRCNGGLRYSGTFRCVNG